MKRRTYRKQRGVSLIAAIFLLTGMSVLGALLSRLLVSGIGETMQEWHASQALYAAESGVSWRLYNGTADANNQVVIPGHAWFSVTSQPTTVGGQTMLRIVSTGTAGTSAGNILASRQIAVTVMLR
jgi:type II secretory pathway component PulK